MHQFNKAPRCIDALDHSLGIKSLDCFTKREIDLPVRWSGHSQIAVIEENSPSLRCCCCPLSSSSCLGGEWGLYKNKAGGVHIQSYRVWANKVVLMFHKRATQSFPICCPSMSRWVIKPWLKPINNPNHWPTDSPTQPKRERVKFCWTCDGVEEYFEFRVIKSSL